MDKQEIYRKAEQAFNQAFEAAKASAKIVSQKAGEAASVSKLFVEKLKLEHKVGKKFTELGNRVYDKAVREKNGSVVENTEVERLIEDARKLDDQLSEVESSLEVERGKLKKRL
ncbi:MAG: hypothetical protein EXS63_09460 [Candidatus Omnitrophica bacterium]|nr:hypothetical protein [Candidatus Omnitrophota bacterium]